MKSDGPLSDRTIKNEALEEAAKVADRQAEIQLLKLQTSKGPLTWVYAHGQYVALGIAADLREQQLKQRTGE